MIFLDRFMTTLLNPPLKKRFIWICLALILAVVAVVYLPSLDNSFVNWDDDVHLLNNLSVRSLSFDNLKAIFTEKVNGTYIPLTTLSFAIEYHFFGYDPFVYHLTNLVLHLLVICLVYFFALRLGLSLIGAGISALIFGLHPMHVESVAWVTERKDVLYAFFTCVLCFLIVVTSDGERS